MLTRETMRKLKLLAVGHEDDPMVKFCNDPRHWYLEAHRIVEGMGLIPARPIRIFDLGCGFGYFGYICREVHHEVVGLDVASPLILEGNRILDNTLFMCDLNALGLLPRIVREADLITMFGVNLRHQNGDYWGSKPYADLTLDVLDRLNPGGRFVIRPNYPLTWDLESWGWRIGNWATIEHTENTITVRPK